MSAAQSSDVPPLPDQAKHITTHNPSTANAVVHSSTAGTWVPLDNNKMRFNVLYTTSEFPPSLTEDKDLEAHNALVASGKLGLVNQGGTVLRTVDFAPDYTCLMHRTQSLDYGIVLEGSIEMVLDSGETKLMQRGDVAIQRGTMHAWRNTSKTEWARMIFVLQESQPLIVGGNEMKQDLGAGLPHL